MNKVMFATFFVISSFLVQPSLSETNYPLVEWLIYEKCSKDSKVMCIRSAKYEIDRWLEENSKFSILVVGKIGSGKTRLVKGLTNYAATDKDGTGSLYAQTLKVTHYEHEYKGMKLSIYDTPGLIEKGSEILDYKYLDEMADHNLSPDLIVYTVKMDTSVGNALSAEDIEVMERVSGTFGRARWKFSMFVLTFANKVKKSKDSTVRENRHLFGTVLNELRFQIRNTLNSFYVNSTIADNIPIFPIGVVQQPKIAAYDEDKSWVEEFWNKSVDIIQKAKEQKESDKEKIKQGECCACPSKDGQEGNGGRTEGTNNDGSEKLDQDKVAEDNEENTLPNQEESPDKKGDQISDEDIEEEEEEEAEEEDENWDEDENRDEL